MQRYDDMLPPVPRPRAWPAQCAAEGIRRGRVALFLGCLTRALDVDTVTAAIRLLTRFGYDVRIPEHQGCCGALHREAGDQRRANELQDGNRAAFSGLDVEAIITLASGCGASLTEPPPGTGTLPAPIRDLHEFLAERPVPDGLMFAPLRQHILVQDPCSLRNVLRAEQAVYRLLERVPELRITPLPGNNVCCGGAGGYVLREPELAERLRAPKLDAIAELRPDFVVSANIGCALHVAAGLRRKRLAMPVVHPAVLLARQLRPA
jgi:glycolate oxidase iron-sulfur subunit